ncbi:MAG: tetratricopeptide repeat protein [Muribaculaceae bacterium]
MKDNKIYLVLAMLALMILPVLAGSKSVLPVHFSDFDRDDEVSDADRQKAEYVFLEAQRQRALDNLPAYFELLRYANSIDPTNTMVSYEIGYLLLSINGVTEDMQRMGLEMMGQHYAECPDDYYETYVYGHAAQLMGESQTSLNVWRHLSELYPDKADVQFALAEAYASNGDFQNAINAYDSLEAAQGKLLTLTSRKISVYMALHDSVNAIKECASLLATAPKNVQYNLLMSRLYATYDMRDSALAYIDRAQASDPDNGGIFLARAQFYNSIGDTVNYDKQVYNALISKNLDVESKLNVLFDYSRDMVQNRDSSERANNLFKVLIEEHPHEKKIHELFSQYLWVRGDYKTAGEQLSYALDVDPASADNWRMLMGCYLMTEQYEKAIEAGKNAIKYNPDNIELYKYIAPAYQQIGEYENALEVYDKAIEVVDSADYESLSDLTTGRGDVYYLMKDSAQAFECYEQALKLNPNNVPAMNNYAYYLSESGIELEKAEKMSYRTISEQPDNATFLDTYAWILFKKKAYKEALVYIEKAMANETVKKSADMLEHYGDILFMNGEPDAALVRWQEALEIEPDRELLKKKVKYKTYFYK